MRLRGTVKWFNPAKGYGFLRGEDGKDYFVHHTELDTNSSKDSEGHKLLASEAVVEFGVELDKRSNRVRAVQVKVVEGDNRGKA